MATKHASGLREEGSHARKVRRKANRFPVSSCSCPTVSEDDMRQHAWARVLNWPCPLRLRRRPSPRGVLGVLQRPIATKQPGFARGGWLQCDNLPETCAPSLRAAEASETLFALLYRSTSTFLPAIDPHAPSCVSKSDPERLATSPSAQE